ncbi:cell division transport system ATP-binding protein [Rubrimonas cliftonensis]|uniref:Cell division transport system ATP-binding protein n=1 Tax=Rubrimonas cliftonensis TaxID=89524 RepID=A0A1H4ANU0_9RHOB|nr:cell division transport system ATP-binding protein [Rubrimonas cliftonensis]
MRNGDRGPPDVIEFEATRFSYDAREVLRGVSLSLEPGSLHFLTGRSGAGKTTLLKLVYLALTPTGGAVKVFGGDTRGADRAAMRRRMGLVLQDCDLLEHLDIRDNIALPLRIAGADVAARAGDIEELAAWVGLGDRLDAFPRELSSGERQRAAVARAVVTAPELVLADEPTGDVDEEAAGRILELFLELNRAGAAVLVATHDMALIRRAQGRGQARTLRLEEGVIIRAGAPL